MSIFVSMRKNLAWTQQQVESMQPPRAIAPAERADLLPYLVCDPR